MELSLAGVKLIDVNDALIRNIVSINTSQNLFDDLSDDPAHWQIAQSLEDEVKPFPYKSRQPIIDRPFEDANWANAIAWPFKHWQASRFSDGSFGVWYGCDSDITSVHETVHHWYHGLLTDAGFQHLAVTGERRLYQVDCTAALWDLRKAVRVTAEVMHTSNYDYPQQLGRKFFREGHPGLVTKSVRRNTGSNYAIFNPAVLFNPRHYCQLIYKLQAGRVFVEKQPGQIWLEMAF
jgi:RES domain